jgi:hypothetical protein
MPEFKAEVAEREAKKAAELAPYIEAAMARKTWMKPLADHEIPVVPASRPRAQINEGGAALRREHQVLATLGRDARLATVAARGAACIP